MKKKFRQREKEKKIQMFFYAFFSSSSKSIKAAREHRTYTNTPQTHINTQRIVCNVKIALK